MGSGLRISTFVWDPQPQAFCGLAFVNLVSQKNDLDWTRRSGRCVSDEQEPDLPSQPPDFREAGTVRSRLEAIHRSATG